MKKNLLIIPVIISLLIVVGVCTNLIFAEDSLYIEEEEVTMVEESYKDDSDATNAEAEMVDESVLGDLEDYNTSLKMVLSDTPRDIILEGDSIDTKSERNPLAESPVSGTASADIVASGTMESGLRWLLTTMEGEESQYILTVSGEGRMDDYSSNSEQPWYSYRENIKIVIIEEGVTSLGSNSFYGFRKLESVVVPDGITVVGDSAFSNCRNLVNIELPDGVTSIGSYSFYNCTNLSSIVIPDGVTCLDDYAFYCCSSLGSVSIPSSVLQIGRGTFSGCSELESIVIPDGVEILKESVFSNCRDLESVVIPNSVTIIENRAFYECSSLVEISIPNGVINFKFNLNSKL